MTNFSKKLQKSLKPPSVRRIQIFSLGSNTSPPQAPFEKFWLHAWLLEGMQSVSDCMQLKNLIFGTLNFICRIIFDTSLVLDP